MGLQPPWTSSDGVYIIAEIGGNHEGDFDYALRLTELACQSGADCVKFQIYTGDSLVSPIESPDRYAHFKKFQLTRSQYQELKNVCDRYGKHFGASVWDVSVLDWASGLLPFFKVGSGDLTAYPVLKRLAATGMPLMLSTGLSTLQEVVDAVDFLIDCDARYKDRAYLSILQCTSMYPIPDKDANLNVIRTLQARFPQYQIGYSDHTSGREAVEVAVALGAEILEVHFTDQREGKVFRDHKVSLVRDEIAELRVKLAKIRALTGSYEKRPTPSELEAKHEISFRRAVYLKRDISAGEIIGEEDLVSLRPNQGIDAREWKSLVGKHANTPLKALHKLDPSCFTE